MKVVVRASLEWICFRLVLKGDLGDPAMLSSGRHFALKCLLIIHMDMIAAILVPIHSNNYYIAFVLLTNYYPLSL